MTPTKRFVCSLAFFFFDDGHDDDDDDEPTTTKTNQISTPTTNSCWLFFSAFLSFRKTTTSQSHTSYTRYWVHHSTDRPFFDKDKQQQKQQQKEERKKQTTDGHSHTKGRQTCWTVTFSHFSPNFTDHNSPTIDHHHHTNNTLVVPPCREIIFTVKTKQTTWSLSVAFSPIVPLLRPTSSSSSPISSAHIDRY